MAFVTSLLGEPKEIEQIQKSKEPHAFVLFSALADVIHKCHPRPSHLQAKSKEITDNLNAEPDMEQGRAYYEGITNYTSSSAQVRCMWQP